MKALGYTLVGLAVAATGVVIVTTLKHITNKPDTEKSSLVDSILYKYTNKDSSYYTDKFVDTRESLMRYDTDTLKRILAGVVSKF